MITAKEAAETTETDPGEIVDTWVRRAHVEITLGMHVGQRSVDFEVKGTVGEETLKRVRVAVQARGFKVKWLLMGAERCVLRISWG